MAAGNQIWTQKRRYNSLRFQFCSKLFSDIIFLVIIYMFPSLYFIMRHNKLYYIVSYFWNAALKCVKHDMYNVDPGQYYEQLCCNVLSIMKCSGSTRGQFVPSGIVAASTCVFVCLCVCVWHRLCIRVYVNQQLVSTIKCDSFKPGSPNSDKRCQRPWLRSRLFCGCWTLTFKVKN